MGSGKGEQVGMERGWKVRTEEHGEGREAGGMDGERKVGTEISLLFVLSWLCLH